MSGPLAALLGARVRRVDLPAPDLVALSLAIGPERTVLLVSLEPRKVAVGCAPERPKGDPASGFATFLRTHVEGAALDAVRPAGTALELVFGREAAEVSLVVEPAPNLVAVREGKIIGALDVPRLRERHLAPGRPYAPPADGRAVTAETELPALLDVGAALVAGRGERAEEGERAALLRALRTERAKVARRLEAIEKDAARADEAPRLRAEGSAILAHASRLGTSREARTLALEGVTLELPAGAAPAEHAQALFARAKKGEAAAAVGARRAEEARGELEKLDRLLAAAGDEDADPGAIARAAGVRAQAPGRKPETEERKPYRTFHGHAGRPILVGRGPKDNDALTTKVARPHDLWLHVRGAHGSHVVVPLDRGESCPAELLVDAAHLAVRFSELEGTSDADVTYVERRHVRKPKGSAPGAVIFERDKTLALRVEPDRLARLLGRSPR